MMVTRTRWSGLMLGLVVAAAAVGFIRWAPADDVPVPGSDPALERTRRQVQMLDDLYKSAVVLITDKYVNKDTDVSAGTAAQALFEVMRKKGYHDVRLLDATGSPYDDDNLPKDAFEKEAVQQLKAGRATVERVEMRAEGRFLRVATAVPVVMDKCVMCHESYKKVKKGEAIGALSYTLKVE